ncbi:MAG: hypothetical protein AVDCRST_MAG49-2527 [uncultured Thermomicrobiales bacterium]|uniref:HTH luxR-type domain-containing protein n=1 Tax=uncultured Thermomicrobiales bacterium TaxID=1645740 RepID=A0A6J4UZL6_9BACT|nr:MAG: hypothetical protein AVDCRST_MAG49-2527 [uncultured Thermomicrobiales bacterium]
MPATLGPDRSASLPAPLAPLVGRRREITAVTALLRDGDVRLVTLTGPGGVGKTRLALSAAAAVAPEFYDGVRFVSLAPVVDPVMVVATLARAVGAREDGDRPLLERLALALGGQRLLLVLDNFEQVVEAAPLVGDLLRACPSLTALVTSRVRLRVSGEREYLVLPLGLPAFDATPTVDEATRSDAVRLFVGRAQAANPGFVVTSENVGAIAGICWRLDGVPLAIELAAARVKILSPAALLSRLERRLPLLTGGPRDAPDRQRTMRDAIAWSHDLLLAEERALFRRLSVFTGGCTVEAARAVGDPEGDLGVEDLDLLASLVDKSLLRLVELTDGEPRFAMLETIREFGLERLAESGEEEVTRAAHARYYLALAERTEPDIYRGRDLGRLLGALEAEHANLGAALAFLTATGDSDGALRLAGALAPFWLFHSHRGEGRRWLERALDPAWRAQASAATRARALGGAATLAFTQGDYARAGAFADENLAVRQELGDSVGIATALNLSGAVRRAQGAFDPAAACFEEALALFDAIGDPGWIALARNNLGILAHWRGDPVRAAVLLREAIALYRTAGDRYAYGVAAALSDLALVTCDRGDHAGAAALFGESLARWREVGTKEGLADWLARVAVLAAASGRPDQAVRLFGAAEELRAAIGYAFEHPERARHARALVVSRAATGEEAFAAAWAAGRALSPTASTAEAMRLIATTATVGAAPSPYGLTPRETAVLSLMTAGQSDREIAAALSISRRTASNHVAAILAKFGVPNRAAAATQAIRLGLA